MVKLVKKIFSTVMLLAFLAPFNIFAPPGKAYAVSPYDYPAVDIDSFRVPILGLYDPEQGYLGDDSAARQFGVPILGLYDPRNLPADGSTSYGYPYDSYYSSPDYSYPASPYSINPSLGLAAPYADDYSPMYYYGIDQNDGTALYQRHGDRPAEMLATMPSRVRSYDYNKEQQSILLNQGNRLSMYNLQNRQLREVYAADGDINNAIFSPDGNRVFFTEKTNSTAHGYRLHNYDWKSSKSSVREGVGDYNFYPYTWRPDGQVVMIDAENNDGNIWIYNANNGAIQNSGYKNPAWISPDGHYAAMPVNPGKDDYPIHLTDPIENRQHGASYKIDGNFRIINLDSKKSYTYGKPDCRNTIMGYTDNKFLYRCSSSKSSDYYSAEIGQPNLTTVDDPWSTLHDWHSDSYGAEIRFIGNAYILAHGDQTVAQSPNRITLIGQIYAKIDPISTDQPYPIMRNMISIKHDAYNPPAINIRSGETVVWKNYDNEPHTVTSGNGQFDSGILEPGETYSLRFTNRGTYYYYCRLHPEMTGLIRVY